MITICVLTYGEYPFLARRVLDSVRHHCRRADYRLVVGANAVGAETREYLTTLKRQGDLDHLILSPSNLNKCPMMRRMFEKVQTEFIWWFDDDSYILEDGALDQWMQFANAAPAATVMWGQLAWCDTPTAFTDLENVSGF